MPSSPFVILGAGFSHAINQHMPLLPDLSREVMSQLGRDMEELDPFGGDLEQWLSYLAQDQPWLTDSDNLRNRALFREVAEVVAITIDEAEAAALQAPMPSWLSRLVWEWSDTEASIVTFNYDTLLEVATSSNGLVSNWADLYGASLAPRAALATTTCSAPKDSAGVSIRSTSCMAQPTGSSVDSTHHLLTG